MKKLFFVFLLTTAIYAINDNTIENSPNSLIVGRDNISFEFKYNSNKTTNKTLKISNTIINKYNPNLFKKIQNNFSIGINHLDKNLDENQKEILQEFYKISQKYKLLDIQQLESLKVLLDIQNRIVETHEIVEETNKLLLEIVRHPEVNRTIYPIFNPNCKKIRKISDIVLDSNKLDTNTSKNKLRCLKLIYQNYEKKYIIDIAGYNSFDNIDKVTNKIIEISGIDLKNLSPSYTPNKSKIESHEVHLNLIMR